MNLFIINNIAVCSLGGKGGALSNSSTLQQNFGGSPQYGKGGDGGNGQYDIRKGDAGSDGVPGYVRIYFKND